MNSLFAFVAAVRRTIIRRIHSTRMNRFTLGCEFPIGCSKKRTIHDRGQAATVAASCGVLLTRSASDGRPAEWPDFVFFA